MNLAILKYPFIELPQPIRIENREQKYTSRKAAVSFVERGIAKWTDEARTAIRFLEPEEQFKARVDRQQQRYWRDVAAQRGGQEVFFVWKSSMSNGYVVMGATPVAIQKRAQLAQGESGGRPVLGIGAGQRWRRNTARNRPKSAQDTRRAKPMGPSWASRAEGETTAQFRYRQT